MSLIDPVCNVRRDAVWMARSHSSAGCVLFFTRTGTHPYSQALVAEAAADFSVTVLTSPTLQTDPLPISPASRSLCKVNKIADLRLKNESVSTGATLSSIVADQIPSLYLDGAALRYSLCPYRSI